jgi:lysophospholipase L1-like esterase
MRRAAIVLAALLTGARAPATTHLYLVGDSTMANKANPAINPEHGWGQMLPRFVDDQVVVDNRALNGRSTKSFIDEGRWAAVASRLQRGDYVVIQFGHNDEKIADSTRYAAPEGAYSDNLRRFVRETRDHGATPILMTPIVRRKFDAAGKLLDTHGKYPAAVVAVAKETGTPFVDMESLTRELVGAAGSEGSKRLYVWVKPGESSMYPEGHQDDTHLSLTGAIEVARLAARSIQEAKLPLSAHIVHVADAVPGATKP